MVDFSTKAPPRAKDFSQNLKKAMKKHFPLFPYVALKYLLTSYGWTFIGSALT